MTLPDANRLERGERPLDERPTDSLPAMDRVHHEVVEISPPSIMTAECRADNALPGDRDEARAGVALEIVGDGFRPICIPDDYTVRGAPQIEDRLVIGGRELSEINQLGIPLQTTAANAASPFARASRRTRRSGALSSPA